MKNNFDYLTSLRGIAAIWVMLYHLKEYIGLEILLKHGYLAVDFFFILSGFVLALTYQEKLCSSNSASRFSLIIDFYVKRVARIFPLHIFVLLIMFCAFLVIDWIKPEDILTGRFSIEAFFQQLFLINNWGFSDRLVWNIPSWSISTEMMAYLLFPLIIYSSHRWSNVTKTFVVVALMVLVALVFANAAAKNIGDKIPQLGLLRCLVEFSLGIYVYSLYQKNEMHLSSWIVLVVAFIIVGIGILTDVPNYLYIPISLLLIFYSFINIEERYIRPLFNPTLVWLGDISYSIYLTHYFARDLLKFSVASLSDIGAMEVLIYLIVVILVSHLTYKFVEMPTKTRCLNWYFRIKRQAVA